MASVFEGVRSLRRGSHSKAPVRHSEATHKQWNRRLEELTVRQAKLVADLKSAWAQEKREQVLKYVEYHVEDYFDPDSPKSLLGLVGCGGIDILVEIVCSDNEWFYATDFMRTDLRAINALNTIIRVLTEVVVVDNSMGWYMFDAYPGLMHRLVSLMQISKLQESCIMLIEHILSVAGPVIDVSKSSSFSQLLSKADDVTLATCCRVIALLVVTGAMAEQSTCTFKLEPFPECLTRMKRIEQQVRSNAAMLLAQENLLERLVKLCEVESDGIRIFHGNRTMTVMAPGEGEAAQGVGPTVDFGDGLGAEEGEDAIEDFMSHLQQLATETGGGAAAQQSLMNMIAQMMNPNNNQAHAPQTGSVQTLGQGLMAASLSGQTTTGAVPLPAGTGAGGEAPAATAGGAAPAAANPQEVLQQVAQGLGQDLPAANSMDSIDFQWFIGHQDSKVRWRFNEMAVTDASDTRYLDYHSYPPSTKEEQKKREGNFIRMLQGKLQHTRQNKKQEDRVNRQSIVNSQSEVLFVLNALLSSASFYDVWTSLTKLNALPRFNAMFDTMFFIKSQQTSVNVERNGNAKPPRRREGLDELEDLEGICDNEDPNHRHDPDTLRKIELLRAVHEYWNAQDRHEMRRLASDTQVAAVRPDIAGKIVQQLLRASEDPCTETLACHCLEGYMRALPFSQRAKETERIGIELGVINHVLRRRLYEFSAMVGEYNSIFPLKRTEGALTLAGECFRYSPVCMSRLEDIMSGRLSFAHDAPATDSFVSTSKVELPKRDIPFAELLQKISCRFPFDVNLFYRSLILTPMAGLRSWKNVTVAPTKESIADGSWHNAADALTPMALSLRKIETSTTQLRRLYYVKKYSAEFVDQLYEHVAAERRATKDDATVSWPASAPGTPSVCDMGPMLTTLINAPGAVPLEMRPHPVFFFENDLRFVNGKKGEKEPGNTPVLHRMCDPSVSDAEKALYCYGPMADEDKQKMMAEDPHCEERLIEAASATPGYFYKPEEYPSTTAFIRDNSAAIVYHIVCDVEAQEMESSEKLCAITTSIIFFLRAFAEKGEAGVCEMLEKMYATHQEKQKDFVFGGSATKHSSWLMKKNATHAKCRDHRMNKDPEVAPDCCNGMTVFDEKYRLDNTGRELFQKRTRNPKDLRGKSRYYHPECTTTDVPPLCPFVNFFRLLCVWIAHYSCCQRYIETLFYCTQIPFHEYKSTALMIWKHLPRYFSFTEEA